MDKLRLVYEQTRRAIWMSHLDTMRTLQRAIKRAGIPIRYSEGFNPHELISILLPLSVGTASLCQIADIRVREDVDIAALPAQLTAVMPEGIRVTDCYENAMKPAELKWMRVNGTWEYDTADTETVAAKCRELFAAPVEVMRKTKRGEGLFTVTEHVRDLTFTAGDGIVTVEGVVSCAEPVVNPGGADTPSGLCAGRRPLLPHGALSRRRNALPIISKFLKLGVDIFQRHDIITLAFDMRECWNR